MNIGVHIACPGIAPKLLELQGECTLCTLCTFANVDGNVATSMGKALNVVNRTQNGPKEDLGLIPTRSQTEIGINPKRSQKEFGINLGSLGVSPLDFGI